MAPNLAKRSFGQGNNNSVCALGCAESAATARIQSGKTSFMPPKPALKLKESWDTLIVESLSALISSHPHLHPYAFPLFFTLQEHLPFWHQSIDLIRDMRLGFKHLNDFTSGKVQSSDHVRSSGFIRAHNSHT